MFIINMDLMKPVVIFKKIIMEKGEQEEISYLQMLKMEVERIMQILVPQLKVTIQECKCFYGQVEELYLNLKSIHLLV